MNYITSLLPFLICFSNLTLSKEQAKKESNTAKYKQEFEVIKPATKKELSKFLPLLLKDKQKAETEFNINKYLYDALQNYDADGYPKIYIVDINNDSHLEYVFVSIEGTGGYLSFEVFLEANGVINKLEEPTVNGNNIIAHAYINPFSKQAEHFVYAQNKIYILCDRCELGLTNRDVSLWQNNEIVQVCDKFWIAEQRQLFNQLYAKKRYKEAFDLLNSFEKDSRLKIDPQTDLWIRNDIALARLKSGSPHTALKIINSIENDTAFAHASKQLKKSIKTNKELCNQELGYNNKGKYDYSWLLQCERVSNNTVIYCDLRMDLLLSAAIPELPEPFSRSQEYLWKDNIKMYLLGPGKRDIEVIDNRYVVFSGFLPHGATTKAFFWCDIQEKVSTVATKEDDTNIYITSRSLNYNELPETFFEQLHKWLKSEEINASNFLFFSPTGMIWPLNVTTNNF